jgi:hypothetical protein
MKTVNVVINFVQNIILPVVTVAFCFLWAPKMQGTEQVAFFSLMAQVLATLLIALALLPRFRGTPAIHWTTLLWVGVGVGLAIFSAVPAWSGLLWPGSFAIVLSSAAATIFSLVASVGPANEKGQRAANIEDLAMNAKRLDPN